MITIKHIIFLVLIFLVPIRSLKRIYLFDKEDFKIAKIINLLVTVIILYILIGDSGFYMMYADFKGFKDMYGVDAGLLNANVSLIAKIISNIISIYFFVVVIGLSRRIKNDRKRFLYFMPIYTILYTIQVNRQLHISYPDLEYENFYLIFSFIWTLVKFLTLFLIYNSKAFKKMMTLDYKRVRELSTGSA